MAGPARLKQEGQVFWDTNPCGGTWASYRDFIAWIQYTEPYAYEILGRYKWAGKRVLDVGCGQGAKLNHLARLGTVGFGIDMSLASLRRAAAGATELGNSTCVLLSLADAECLPYAEACCDAVLSFGVLHHTPDTQRGVREIYRVLKPGGLAMVMLYRSGTPKWWMTSLARIVSSVADRVSSESGTLANRLRSRHIQGDARGTALLELFGCPILKAFSNRQVRGMFAMFTQVSITNHQPGFRRLADILPILRPLEVVLRWIDYNTLGAWGFYQVVEAWK